jgi:hypothetical protein
MSSSLYDAFKCQKWRPPCPARGARSARVMSGDGAIGMHDDVGLPALDAQHALNTPSSRNQKTNAVRVSKRSLMVAVETVGRRVCLWRKHNPKEPKSPTTWRIFRWLFEIVFICRYSIFWDIRVRGISFRTPLRTVYLQWSLEATSSLCNHVKWWLVAVVTVVSPAMDKSSYEEKVQHELGCNKIIFI